LQIGFGELYYTTPWRNLIVVETVRRILSRVSDRRRGIVLTIGFITPYSQLQLSLSGLSQTYNSRFTHKLNSLTNPELGSNNSNNSNSVGSILDLH
jgi:hypothetical protein